MSDATAPTVSVGLPVFNGERYLAEAIESLLAQTFGDFELLVGDNGSTDRTAEIARDFAARDSRVRHLHSAENRGAAWNYNRLFHESRGRYFRWAAHDDLCAPTYLERVVALLEDSPDDVVSAHSLTTLIDEHGAVTGEWDDAFDLDKADPASRLVDLVRNIVMSNIFFGLTRRSALARTRLHGAYPSADWVLLAELALLGRLAVVPERLFLRRVHPEMSRYANLTLTDVANWFEPGRGRDTTSEYWNLLGQHIVAVRRSPLGPLARAEIVARLLPVWFARHKRAMLEEARHSVGGLLPRRR